MKTYTTILCASLALASSFAQATIVRPGESIVSSLTDEPFLFDGVISNADIITTSFTTGTFLDQSRTVLDVRDFQNNNNIVANAWVDQYVYRAPDGTVDFYWQVTNSIFSSLGIAALRMTLNGLGSEDVNLENVTNANAPNEIEFLIVDRFGGDGFISPENINVGFSDPIIGSTLFDARLGAGETSSLILLDTTALDYNSDGSFDLITASNGSLQLSSQGVAFAPTFATSPVPLPAAVWLFGSGLIGLGAMARKKTAT